MKKYKCVIIVNENRKELTRSIKPRKGYNIIDALWKEFGYSIYIESVSEVV